MDKCLPLQESKVQQMIEKFNYINKIYIQFTFVFNHQKVSYYLYSRIFIRHNFFDILSKTEI